MSGSVHLRSLEFSVFAIMAKRIDKLEMLWKMHGQGLKYLNLCSLNCFYILLFSHEMDINSKSISKNIHCCTSLANVAVAAKRND